MLLCHADNAKITPSTRLAMMSAERSVAVKGVGSSMKISAFIKYDDESCLDSIRDLGAEIRTQTASIVTATIPVDKLVAVSELSGVVAIEAAEKVDYMMDRARSATLVDKVQEGASPLTSPFLGKGVIVGAIDGGLDFAHPAFRNADRSELRLKRVWKQDATTGTPPAGYTRGALYSTPEAILAAKTDLEYWSHGSHVLNIAAGADMSDGNTYYGVARESDLIFSNFTNLTPDIVDGLNYMFSYADSVGMPAVINMSLGTQMGPHDGTSLIDVAIDELVGPGRIVVGASGNDGQVEVHIQKTLTEDDTQMFAGLAFLESTQGFCPIDIWGEAGKTMKVNVVTVDKTTGKTVYKSRTFDASNTYTGKISLQMPYDFSSGYFNISTGISPLNGKPNVTLDLAIGDFYPEKAIAVIVTGEAGETVHAWTSSTYAVFRQQTSDMDVPDLYTSTCEVGGIAKGIITVGSYNTRQNVTLENGTLNESVYTEGALSQFSNRGPTVDGRLKPEICAPGCMIISALNSNGGYSDGLVATHTWGDAKYYYGAMFGTSMAAPHVAGIIATWLGADPTLTPEKIRTVFSQTAISDEYTGVTPNNNCGYGKIDAYNGLLNVLQSSSVDEIAQTTDEPIFCNVVGGELRVALLTDLTDAAISVYNVTGSMISRESYSGGPGDEYVLSLNGHANGVYLVTVDTPAKRYFFKVLNN